MASVTTTKALTNFFNQGDGKVGAKDWLAELKKLSTAEKVEMAREIAALDGLTLQLTDKEKTELGVTA